MDLDDDSTFKDNNVIPGGTMTMQVWHEDAWLQLVQVAAKGNPKKVGSIGFISMQIPIAEIVGECLGSEQHWQMGRKPGREEACR